MSENTNINSNNNLLFNDFRNSLKYELLNKAKISKNDRLINALLNNY